MKKISITKTLFIEDEFLPGVFLATDDEGDTYNLHVNAKQIETETGEIITFDDFEFASCRIEKPEDFMTLFNRMKTANENWPWLNT